VIVENEDKSLETLYYHQSDFESEVKSDDPILEKLKEETKLTDAVVRDDIKLALIDKIIIVEKETTQVEVPKDEISKEGVIK
jgi:hypothetical protein